MHTYVRITGLIAVATMGIASQGAAGQSPTQPGSSRPGSSSSGSPLVAAAEIKAIKIDSAEATQLRAAFAKRDPLTPDKVAKLKAAEHKKLAEALRLAKVGQYPVYRVKVDPAPATRQEAKAADQPLHRGTVIVPHSDAEGDMLKLQQEFVAAMAKHDPQPPSRTAHFLWLNNTAHFKEGKARTIGWYGVVTNVEQQPEGRWLIQTSIQPWIVYPGRGILRDKILETYEYSHGRLRLVDSNAHIATSPDLQVFPIEF